MAYGDDNVILSEASASGFVPTLWSDEILAAHKKNLVLSMLVRKVQVKGKKGEAIKLPKPTRGSASAKAANTIVTTIPGTNGASITLNLTAHWEYSRLIEDIAEVHATTALRRFYTDDAGYALALAKDSVLFNQSATLNGGSGVTATFTGAVIGSDGTTAFVDNNDNEAALTDAGIRRVIQVLDDNNIPMNDRSLTIPPVSRRTLMGIARFTEQAFSGEAGSSNTIRNGRLANVYGVEVYVSSNCPTCSGGARIALLMHKDAMILGEVLGPRVQTQYKQEYLGTLMTADTIFGVAEAYDLAGVAIAVTA
jgi:hypothetical protein